MIDGEGVRLAATAATLDDLFRRVGVRHPHTLALADPPNRDAFAWGAPRKLSFAQADRAISACAARLRGLGLQTDSIVAMHLPNTVESIVTFLGVLRAGMVAVPLPLLWRKAEIRSALGRVGAKAIVTCSRIGTDEQAEIAMQSAADLFSVRHVCGFGHGLPDGLVSLDDIFSSDGVVAVSPRIGRDTSVAAITFNLDAAGFVPISRSHVELVAGGLEIVRATGAAADAPVLSTIPITSFAGIALTMMPWLLCGGALHLHHGFEAEAFAAQCREIPQGTLVLPAPAVPPIAKMGLIDATQTIVALWRAPERVKAAKTWNGPSVLIDVATFGEIGLVAARRGDNGLPVLLPLGPVHGPALSGGPAVLETARTSVGTLALRGRMVPALRVDQPLPVASEVDGYVDTGFPCRHEQVDRTLIVTGPPADIIDVGGYCLRLSQVDALVSRADPDATIVALPDGDLVHRLAGTAPDRNALQGLLKTEGVNPLIVGAFDQQGTPEAA
jgi:hypothetical protein